MLKAFLHLIKMKLMLNMKYISVALCAYSEVEKKSNNGDDSSTEGTRGGGGAHAAGDSLQVHFKSSGCVHI